MYNLGYEKINRINSLRVARLFSTHEKLDKLNVLTTEQSALYDNAEGLLLRLDDLMNEFTKINKLAKK